MENYNAMSIMKELNSLNKHRKYFHSEQDNILCKVKNVECIPIFKQTSDMEKINALRLVYVGWPSMTRLINSEDLETFEKVMDKRTVRLVNLYRKNEPYYNEPSKKIIKEVRKKISDKVESLFSIEEVSSLYKIITVDDGLDEHTIIVNKDCEMTVDSIITISIKEIEERDRLIFATKKENINYYGTLSNN